MKFKVFDKNNRDVTEEAEWYLDIDGNLYVLTNDIGCPLHEAENFHYEIITK